MSLKRLWNNIHVSVYGVMNRSVRVGLITWSLSCRECLGVRELVCTSSVWTRDVYADAAFFSLYVAIIFLISAMALPGFKPCGTRNSHQKQTSAGQTSPEVSAVYLRAGSGAVHDGVTAVQRERVLEFGEPLLSEVIARVDHPAVRLRYKHNWARAKPHGCQGRSVLKDKRSWQTKPTASVSVQH